MTQKIMMVVEQPRPVVMQTTEFMRGSGSSDYDALINKPSVNGVTLDGDKTTAELGLPTKTSDLTNDSGFVNAAGAATASPVQSVNGKTGAVVLNASDVGAGTYSKPSGGIPKTDLASAVQTSLGKADTAYQKPSSGIPASDLAAGVIPTVPTKISELDNDSGFITSADVPTAVSELTNDSGYQTAAQVETAIDSHLSTVYKAAGTVASISALPAPSAAYLGYVYNVEAAFTTTADFAEGAGIDYPAGTDVAIIAVQSGGSTVYKYDALSGFVDLSGYIAKPSTASSGQVLAFSGTEWTAQTLPPAPDLSGYATEQWVQNQGYLTQHQSLADYQTKAIVDTGGYYTTDTVEGALQEIGAELSGINTLIGSGVIA